MAAHILVHELKPPEDDAFGRFLVTSEAVQGWVGEPVLVFFRRSGDGSVSFWALQESCPHAGISLAEADIEDFGSTDGLGGPCLACPAHMYVFDAQSGECITKPKARTARTYPVTHETAANGSLHVYLGTEPCLTSTGASPDNQRANHIQLALVEAGLKRRFGNAEDGSSAPGVDVGAFSCPVASPPIIHPSHGDGSQDPTVTNERHWIEWRHDQHRLLLIVLVAAGAALFGALMRRRAC